MTSRIETSRRINRLLLAAAAACFTLGAAGTALAAPVTFNLNYTALFPPGTTATAVGTFTVDSSLLDPAIETQDLSDLLCFNLAITVPGIPVQNYTKGDLDGWILRTTAIGGGVASATFRMAPGRCATHDFIIIDLDYSEIGFYACPGPFGPNDAIAVFGEDSAEGGVCLGDISVPALSLPGLVALLLLVGVAAVLLLRRGATLG